MSEIKIPIRVELGDSTQKLKTVEGGLKGMAKGADDFAGSAKKASESLQRGFAADPTKSIKQQLREANVELQNIVAKFGALSPQAQAAAARVAELRDVIEDSNRAAQAADLDDRFRTIGTAITGVTSAFQGALAIQGLFGEESKATEEALKKVQAAMALTQGITGVFEGVKAFKQLGAQIASSTALAKVYSVSQSAAAVVTRAFGGAVVATSSAFKGLAVAIAATGIGALVVAIGAAIPLLIKLFSSTKTAEDANKSLSKTEEELGNQIDRTNQKIEARSNLLQFETNLAKLRAEAAGASEEEIRNIELNGLKGRLEEAKKLQNDALNDYKSRLASALIKLRDVQKEGSKKEKEDAEKNFDSIKKQLGDQYLQRKNVVTELEQNLELTKAGFAVQDSNNRKKEAEKNKELAKRNADEILNVQKNLSSKLKEIDISQSIFNAGPQLEQRLAAFQEALKQYLKLGFTIDSPKLEPIIEQINQLRLAIGAEKLKASVKIELDENKVGRLQELKNTLTELQNRQLTVSTRFEFLDLQTQIDATQKEIDNISGPLVIPARIKPELILPDKTDAEKKAEELGAAISKTLESGLSNTIGGLGESIGQAISKGGNVFEAIGNSLLGSLGSLLIELGKQIIAANIVINKAKLAFGVPILGVLAGAAIVALGSALKASIEKKTRQGFATGGFVSGPGSERSDSIPARLSNGEYVINAKSVRKYGKQTFDSLNRGAPPKELVENIRSFSRSGGSAKALVNRFDSSLADALASLNFKSGGYVQRFQDGGLVQATRSFNRNSSTSKALVNRFDVPQIPNVTVNETFERQVPYIATTRISGQDLRLVLERADKRFNTVT